MCWFDWCTGNHKGGRWSVAARRWRTTREQFLIGRNKNRFCAQLGWTRKITVKSRNIVTEGFLWLIHCPHRTQGEGCQNTEKDGAEERSKGLRINRPCTKSHIIPAFYHYYHAVYWIDERTFGKKKCWWDPQTQCDVVWSGSLISVGRCEPVGPGPKVCF